MKNLLKNLIKAEPTPDNGEIRAAKVLSDFFDAYGIDTAVEIWDENRANFFAHIKSTGQKQALMFVAHLDVVPPGSVEWKHSPFDAVEEDGKIHGRGSTDMKGSIAAAAKAIAEVVKSDVELKGDIIFAATAGEETDSSGIKRFAQQYTGKLPQSIGIIIPEPTDFDMITAHRGMLWLNITTIGKTAHGSMPHLGINAISLMNKVMNRLSEYSIPFPEHPLLGKSFFSINEINGGKATNVVPDQCTIHIDARTLPGQNHDDIMNDFRKILENLKSEDAQFKADISVIRQVDYLQTDNNCEFIRRLAEITGIDKQIAVNFTTDGPFLAGFDAPLAIFGPGKPEICHKPDEYIEFGDVERAMECYKNIILNFLS